MLDHSYIGDCKMIIPNRDTYEAKFINDKI
jgi:hypothetical protein